MADEVVKTLVTQRETMPENVTAVTPRGIANVEVVALAWWKIIAIRTGRVYLQALAGFMTAGGLGLDKGLLPHDLYGLLRTSTALALAPAFFTLLQNAGELLAKLDVTNPTLRG